MSFTSFLINLSSKMSTITLSPSSVSANSIVNSVLDQDIYLSDSIISLDNFSDSVLFCATKAHLGLGTPKKTWKVRDIKHSILWGHRKFAHHHHYRHEHQVHFE